MDFETIGVVGAGNIGSSVAADLLLHGLRVIVVDVSADILQRAKTDVLRGVRTAPLLSKALPKLFAANAAARLTLTVSLADLAGCGFIVENVTEDWQIKKSLYERLDQCIPEGVCIGVNTSCLPITQLAALTGRSANVVGLHFMNPVPLMPTVEVIPGEETSDATLDIVHRLLTRLNKTAVVVRDSPGFISSRLSHVFMNEAAFALQEGVATAAQIDTIFKTCYGHKMGPLETADLIGLDTVVRSLNVLHDSFKDPKYRCCPLLENLVQAGHMGRKTGSGFHRYPESL